MSLCQLSAYKALQSEGDEGEEQHQQVNILLCGHGPLF